MAQLTQSISQLAISPSQEEARLRAGGGSGNDLRNIGPGVWLGKIEAIEFTRLSLLDDYRGHQ